MVSMHYAHYALMSSNMPAAGYAMLCIAHDTLLLYPTVSYVFIKKYPERNVNLGLYVENVRYF